MKKGTLYGVSVGPGDPDAQGTENSESSANYCHTTHRKRHQPRIVHR